MARDEPRAYQALTLPPQNGPNLDKPPCQCPSLNSSTTLLKRAWAGLRDSVGQLCSVSRGLMDRHLVSVVWQCCTAEPAGPRVLSASATAQQGTECQAVTATLCQSPGISSLPEGLRSLRDCDPGLECANNLVRASGARSGGPRRVGLLGMKTSALSSAAKCTHGLPRAFDAFPGSGLQL